MERPGRRFLFRLAGHLKKSVAEILDDMDSRELSEWIAFASIEPLEGDRGDIHAGIVASTMANTWRGANSKALEVMDFVPRWGESEKEKEKEDAWVEKLKEWAKRSGAEEK